MAEQNKLWDYGENDGSAGGWDEINQLDHKSLVYSSNIRELAYLHMVPFRFTNIKYIGEVYVCPGEVGRPMLNYNMFHNIPSLVHVLRQLRQQRPDLLQTVAPPDQSEVP